LEKIDIQDVSKLASFEMLAKQVVEGFITGLHRSPFHGFSVEFAEHRQYNTGESTRHIDWKLYAKTDKLFVKRYEEETNLRCHIIMDTSTSMFFPVKDDKVSLVKNKATFSAYAAAALTELMRKQRDAFGLTTIDEKINFHSPDKSSVLHQRHLLNELEKLTSPKAYTQKKTTSLSKLIHQLAEMLHRRSLVIIFSDMFANALNAADIESEKELLFQSLQHLRHNKHEVILFHVHDAKLEHGFDFDNRPYRFIDLESGAEVKLNPLQIKEQYTQALTKYIAELKLKAAQYKIEFMEADINEGFEQILWNYLVKRAKLY
jgi:uncharacterized protein (DUF58 family)